MCSFISAVMENIYKVFLQNRFKWVEIAPRLLRSFAARGIGCLLWPGLGEHSGQYITIIKFQGGQEAESKKNWNLMLASGRALIFDGLVVAFLATFRPVEGLMHVGVSVFVQTLAEVRPRRSPLTTTDDSLLQKQ